MRIELWLENYCKANPSLSKYAFCSMPKHPGYFWICFQMGENKPKGAWGIKVVPNAFELHKTAYPNMVALKNGFKLLIQSGAAARTGGGAVPRR
jgi:transcription elongation factor SPT6